MTRRLIATVAAVALLAMAAIASDSSTNGNSATVEGLSATVSASAVLENSSGATVELLVTDRGTADLSARGFTGHLDPVFDIAGLLQILAQLLDPIAASIPRTDVTNDGVVDAADVQRRAQLAD